MNREEALIYLPVQDADERDDLYEEKLFECKQFLINRFPIGKIIKSRMDKILKVEEAFLALGGSVKPFSSEKRDEILTLSNRLPTFQSLQEAFDWYHSERNLLKLKLNGAQSAREMEAYLQGLLTITKVYAEQWFVSRTPTDANPISSQEPDPMELQAAFKQFDGTDKLTSAVLETLTDDHVLLREAKRLTFWLTSEE